MQLEHPRLCGGTFLTLLLQVKKINKETAKHYPNSFIWKGLAQIFDNAYANSFNGKSASTTTSKYKSCESSNSGYLCLDDELNLKNLNEKVENEYGVCLEKMQKYISSHLIVDEKHPWLVHALLELIGNDDTINREEEFYAQKDGSAITKEGLMNCDEISVPALLIGIWHFIMNQRRDNTVGRQTFLSWTKAPSEKKAERPFSSDIGKSFNRKLRLDFGNLNSITSEFTSQDVADTYAKYFAAEEENPYKEYLEKITEKYNRIKTLLYNNEPKPFYDFYVCNKLQKKIYVSENESSYRNETYENVTVERLAQVSKYIIISGTGGLGKSMMMRHLLLSSARSAEETGRIPIFVNLKEYTSEMHLLDIFYEKLTSLGLDQSEEEIRIRAMKGGFVFLLDGYDEIYSEEKENFDSAIELFTDRFSKNVFIISSRPTNSFFALSRYTVLELCQFTKEQAVTLINKLDFRSDEPDIKQNFIKAIHDRLYKTHRDFIGNPLLLTIMLMTFERFADVPSKMHVFYREAYETLATKHDATKGAYKRRLYTGLNADEFEKYLAEFCARTYKEERFEFDDEDMEVAFGLLNEVKRNQPAFTYKEFTGDLTDNLCLLYQEGSEYHFTHRSFQEYFCALFFSRQKDKHLWEIGKFFNRRHSHSSTDQTFAMLYDMITDKVEEYIFLPYLEGLFQTCDNVKGYWTFLEEIYPFIYYHHGLVAISYISRACQFLYDFITSVKGMRARSIFENDLPFDERAVYKRYGRVNINWFDDEDPDSWELVEIDSIDERYIEEFGEPEEQGWNLELNIYEMMANSDEWQDMMEALDQDTFPLKMEYFVVRSYYESLKKSIEEKQAGSMDELFDLF